MPPELRASALWFVGQQQVTAARAALTLGRRRQALALLWKARRTCLAPRWVWTLAMALTLPAALAERWQQSRLRGGARRAAISVPIEDAAPTGEAALRRGRQGTT